MAEVPDGGLLGGTSLTHESEHKRVIAVLEGGLGQLEQNAPGASTLGRSVNMSQKKDKPTRLTLEWRLPLPLHRQHKG